MKVSLVISTYNNPKFLNLVLRSVGLQSMPPFEVIVVDDGSLPETTELVNRWRQDLPFRVVLCHQPDKGFRLSRSRNLGIIKASGDVLMFIDGDCILPEDFVKTQASLAGTGKIVFGNRKLLTAIETENVLVCPEIISTYFSGRKFWNLPLGWLRIFPKRGWKSIRGFMIIGTRTDIRSLGGFDEVFDSWGLEDSDFAVRAIRRGLHLVDSRFKTSVLHLYHPEPNPNDKSSNEEHFHNCLEDQLRDVPVKSCVQY